MVTRLLAVTDRAAIRWFDLSVPSWPMNRWQTELVERMGAQLDIGGQPVMVPGSMDISEIHVPTSQPATQTAPEANR